MVLFNHARGVEKYSLPEGSDLKVHIPRPNEEDDSIFVSEIVPSHHPEEDPSARKEQRGPIRLLDMVSQKSRAMTLPQG